jgi:hypothetical protein
MSKNRSRNATRPSTASIATPSTSKGERQETSSGPSALQLQSRHWALVPLVILANAGLFLLWHFGNVIRLSPRWTWTHKLLVLRFLWKAFWPVATLSSVSYLVFDRIYETAATISSPASDPRDPFLFPFSIANNSHLFPIYNVQWTCRHISTKSNVTLINVSVEWHTQSKISPGTILNIDCNDLGPRSHIIHTDTPLVYTEAVIDIELRYDVSIFDLFSKTIHPDPTRFTWIAQASNPQWVRGEIAH